MKILLIALLVGVQGFVAQATGCTETELISGSKYRVTDSYVKASSQYGGAGSHGPARSRLNTKDEKGKSGGWCAIPRTTDQWIQVDFRKSMLITSFATQGRNLKVSEWVTSYLLQYNDGRGWMTYIEHGINKTFSGNTDRDTVVKHTLRMPLYARYIRLVPVTWHNWICLRWELYGCDFVGLGCNAPILTGSPFKVDDCQLSASGEHSSWGAVAARSRLNMKDETGKRGAWCSDTNDKDQWIQVDFKQRVLVSAVASQGKYMSYSRSYSDRVIGFHVLYSDNGYTWSTYATGTAPTKFGSNAYSQSVSKQAIAYPFIARYVRLNPITWRSNICLRWEVYGCPI